MASISKNVWDGCITLGLTNNAGKHLVGRLKAIEKSTGACLSGWRAPEHSCNGDSNSHVVHGSWGEVLSLGNARKAGFMEGKFGGAVVSVDGERQTGVNPDPKCLNGGLWYNFMGPKADGVVWVLVFSSRWGDQHLKEIAFARGQRDVEKGCSVKTGVEPVL